MTAVTTRRVFSDLDSAQETVILKHKEEQEPLSVISFITMKTLVEWLNTGTLKINDQNIRQLMYASDLLGMSGVESSCFSYMRSQLTVGNCVRCLLLAQDKPAWTPLANHIRDCWDLSDCLYDCLSRRTPDSCRADRRSQQFLGSLSSSISVK